MVIGLTAQACYESPEPGSLVAYGMSQGYYQKNEYPTLTDALALTLYPIKKSRAAGKEDALAPHTNQNRYLPLFKDETNKMVKSKSCKVLKKRFKEKNKELIEQMNQVITDRMGTEKSIVCCGITFVTYKEICDHFKEMHTTNNLACPHSLCTAQAFTHRIKLVDHYMQTHCNPLIFACIFNQCEKKYKNRGSLLVHIKKCIGDKSLKQITHTTQSDLDLLSEQSSLDETISNRYNFFDKIEELIADTKKDDEIIDHHMHCVEDDFDLSDSSIIEIQQPTPYMCLNTTDRKQFIKDLDCLLDTRLQRSAIACCNNPPFKTRKELLKHFEQSHLYNGQFKCPCNGCVHPYISDSQVIVDHYLSHVNPHLYLCVNNLCVHVCATRKKFIDHISACFFL